MTQSTIIAAEYFKNYLQLLINRYISLYASTGMKVNLSDNQDSLQIPICDYLILNGNLQYQADIQAFLETVRSKISSTGRLVIVYYSSLWKPLICLATFLKIRKRTPEHNWISHKDMENFLLLSGFELIRNDQKILIPIYLPFLSEIVNRFLAPLPFFRFFTLINVTLAKPLVNSDSSSMQTASVSIIVPARNEEGNIEEIIRRIPKLSPKMELIFVEGHSKDKTWEKIQEISKRSAGDLIIKAIQQDGIGKGDAVRKGFALAQNDVLMILDADLTVPPEDLPKFYRAITSGLGEYINGSRLVYPMEKKAMQFLNMVGNKFFAIAFSFVLGQRFKDTLCGTKAISRQNYERLAQNRSYFGEFDPFGDFDLIFGSARMGLKMIEIPISYRERSYGQTNISRWSHGALLLRMLLFAARRLKFI